MLVDNLHRAGDGVSDVEWRRLTREWVGRLKELSTPGVPVERDYLTEPFRKVGLEDAIRELGGRLEDDGSKLIFD